MSKDKIKATLLITIYNKIMNGQVLRDIVKVACHFLYVFLIF